MWWGAGINATEPNERHETVTQTGTTGPAASSLELRAGRVPEPNETT
jgi:hypothetical protein